MKHNTAPPGPGISFRLPVTVELLPANRALAADHGWEVIYRLWLEFAINRNRNRPVTLDEHQVDLDHNCPTCASIADFIDIAADEERRLFWRRALRHGVIDLHTPPGGAPFITLAGFWELNADLSPHYVHPSRATAIDSERKRKTRTAAADAAATADLFQAGGMDLPGDNPADPDAPQLGQEAARLVHQLDRVLGRKPRKMLSQAELEAAATIVAAHGPETRNTVLNHIIAHRQDPAFPKHPETILTSWPHLLTQATSQTG